MLGVALAAGAGSVARYLVDLLTARRLGAEFPWGTLLVNTSGSFLLGLVAGGLSGTAATVLGAGFAGGYTTLSTLVWESLALAEDGSRTAAALDVGGSLALGLAAAALGLVLAG